MPNAIQIKKYFKSREGIAVLSRLYPAGVTSSHVNRIEALIDIFVSLHGDSTDISVFTSPGRTEIGGNHTDHNHGRVLAASIDLDIIAVAARNDDGVIRLKSEGYDANFVNISELTPLASEAGNSNSLIRGVCASFSSKKLKYGGFNAVVTSNVLSGSGLSSSAAFEMLLCTILSEFYNEGTIHPIEMAKIGQFAENRFFGKPCGLLDQMGCAYGGLIAIDFMRPDEPEVEEIDFDFVSSGYRLCITNTGGSHADLTAHYAAIPSEMKTVAQELGVQFLAEADEDAFYSSIPLLREKTGDRAILRAIHFFEDNRRVSAERDALKDGDIVTFLKNVNASGNSSLKYLQNVYNPGNISEQSVLLGLALSDIFLCGRGAHRVHGGGFAGTIQAFVPTELVAAYKSSMEAVFGAGACYILCIRPVGSLKIV